MGILSARVQLKVALGPTTAFQPQFNPCVIMAVYYTVLRLKVVKYFVADAPGLCCSNYSILKTYIFHNINILRHLKLGIALAIPASSDEK